MKFLIAFILFANSLVINPTKDEVVYVCVSSGAVAYHQKLACGGLQVCSHKIVKTIKSDAIKKYKLRACKRCY